MQLWKSGDGVKEEELKILLYSDPKKFVLSLQRIIQFTVNDFTSGRGLRHLQDDLVQEVSLRLLMDNKISSIRKYYNGKAKLSNYLIQIIKNLCRDILKSIEKPVYRTFEEELDSSRVEFDIKNHILNNDVIESALDDFEYAMRLDAFKMPKTQICFKLRCKIQVNLDDLTKLLPNLEHEEIKELVEKINNGQKMIEKTGFRILVPYIKNISDEESLKSYARDRAKKIIAIFSKLKPEWKLHHKDLCILVEYFYSRRSL